VIDPALFFKSKELAFIAGCIDDRTDPVVDQDRVTVGIRPSPNEFYRAFGKIIQFMTLSGISLEEGTH
jgi:hypothetical protein